jgi:hypothetical protein
MLIRRSELRLAFAAGLGNAFANLSGLPFGYYVPLAVLAVGVGSYGGSLALGRERILGSALGSALLVVSFKGLATLPMPLALAFTLAAQRLLGEVLGLKAGYKVGGFIVVMGWLVHGGQLDGWLSLRLGWTAFGVLLALLSLRWFWPCTSYAQILSDNNALLADLQALYGQLASRLAPPGDAVRHADGTPFDRRDADHYQALRFRLLALRRQLPSLQEELGLAPRRHPFYQLMQALDRAASRLVNAFGEMARRLPPLEDAALLDELNRVEADLLLSLANRMGEWRECLAMSRGGVPPPPATPWLPPESWHSLERLLHDRGTDAISLERQERIAARLMLCRLAEQAMVETERLWVAVQG